MAHTRQIILAIGCMMLVSCSTEKTVETLSPKQRDELNQILANRRSCQLQALDALDDGKTDIQQITELVSWKCTHHDDAIHQLLYKRYGLSLGGTYQYITTLKESAPRQIAESILAKRKIQSEEGNTLDKLYKR